MSRGWGWRPARTRGPRGPASCSCQAWRKAGDDAHTCTPPPAPPVSPGWAPSPLPFRNPGGDRRTGGVSGGRSTQGLGGGGG